MFLIDNWLDELTQKLKDAFKNRINFIGLQGSYRRGEATENSDVDIVVILDTLTVKDLIKYRMTISKMPQHEKACGFISGKDEIINWDKSDLFQFYHDTKPLYGSIDYLLPLISKADIKRAIKLGACNLYHMCCHNFLYEKSTDILQSLYKSSFFILQAKFFDETNDYISSKHDLIEKLKSTDKDILDICIQKNALSEIDETDFILYSERLMKWSSSIIQTY